MPKDKKSSYSGNGIGLITVILIFTSAMSAWAENASSSGQVTLLFYDRNGKELSFDDVKNVSNNQYDKSSKSNDGEGYDNDALVDPTNLRALKNSPVLFASGKNLAFKLTDKPIALALDWPTEPLGFSMIILDNGGRGFTQSATINFTYQAAVDAKRRLDKGLAARPNYQRSDEFKKAYAAMESHLKDGNDSLDQAVIGKEGQLALDYLAVADGLMLREYGMQMAVANKEKITPWLGLTIDTPKNYKENIDMAVKITKPYGWIRVVFDPGPPSVYTDLIAYAKSKGLKILGQPVDSSYDKKFTRKQYVQRFKDYMAAFPDVDAWEVGNEINGDWLTPEIPQKVAEVAAYCKSMHKTTVLTFFYQINTGGPEKWSMFTWINEHLPQSTRDNIDVVLISLYEEQAPLGIAFDQVMTQLRAEFPKQKIGIGELGYWIKGQRAWWELSKENAMFDGLVATASKYYPASFGYEGSVGGCFWWNFVREFKTEPRLQKVVSDFRDEIKDSK
jgi:hypothetical protein